MKDTQRQFETLEIHSIRIRYETEPERTVTYSPKVEQFEDGYDCREVFVYLWDALPRHAPVEVIITADAIRPGGERVPVEFQEKFFPGSLDWVGNWFSWAVSA